MSNVQIQAVQNNATTDKLKVNPLLIHEEVSLIFRWLTLSPVLTSSCTWKSGYEEVRGFTQLSPRETQAGEYEVIIPAAICMMHRVGWGGVGFKWLVHNL